MMRSPRSLAYDDAELSLRRQIRLLVLLDAAASSGLTPLPLALVHAIAYLSNVLAPIWNLEPFDGKVLKRRGTPFYPSLQWDLDRLVGRGLVVVSDIRYLQVEGKWQLDGEYRVNRSFSSPVLRAIHSTRFEQGLVEFCGVLTEAVAGLPAKDAARALLEDAAYSDPNVDISNVVDFAEGKTLNYAANAAATFRPDVSLTPAERVHLYVAHLQARSVRRAS
jgi:hypothetical protein